MTSEPLLFWEGDRPVEQKTITERVVGLGIGMIPGLSGAKDLSELVELLVDPHVAIIRKSPHWERANTACRSYYDLFHDDAQHHLKIRDASSCSCGTPWIAGGEGEYECRANAFKNNRALLIEKQQKRYETLQRELDAEVVNFADFLTHGIFGEALALFNEKESFVQLQTVYDAVVSDADCVNDINEYKLIQYQLKRGYSDPSEAVGATKRLGSLKTKIEPKAQKN